MDTCFPIQMNKNALMFNQFSKCQPFKWRFKRIIEAKIYQKNYFKQENLLKGHREGSLVSEGELIKYFHAGHFVIPVNTSHQRGLRETDGCGKQGEVLLCSPRSYLALSAPRAHLGHRSRSQAGPRRSSNR